MNQESLLCTTRTLDFAISVERQFTIYFPSALHDNKRRPDSVYNLNLSLGDDKQRVLSILTRFPNERFAWIDRILFNVHFPIFPLHRDVAIASKGLQIRTQNVRLLSRRDLYRVILAMTWDLSLHVQSPLTKARLLRTYSNPDFMVKLTTGLVVFKRDRNAGQGV